MEQQLFKPVDELTVTCIFQSLENQIETAMDSVQAEVGSIKWMALARDYNLWRITVSPESTDYQQSPPVPSLAEIKRKACVCWERWWGQVGGKGVGGVILSVYAHAWYAT